MTQHEASTGHAAARSWPDLPLIIEQLQEQLDALREVVEVQHREMLQQRARLDALERR